MELDDAYANMAHIPDAEAYPPRWTAEAQAFRDRLAGQGRAELGLRYGDAERSWYDLFMPEGAAKGLCIFVHGGYWLKFDPHTWSHFASGPLARGWAVAMPAYTLCPETRISGITSQVAQAVSAIAGRVDGPMTLAGHSAGGHLVARMTAPGMLPDDVSTRLAHVVPISPLSDLRPLMRTSMNADLKLDEDEAVSESPINQPVPPMRVTVWVGGAERPAFLDQAQWLAEAWDCDRVVVPDRHHFDVIDALKDPDGDLVARLTSTA